MARRSHRTDSSAPRRTDRLTCESLEARAAPGSLLDLLLGGLSPAENLTGEGHRDSPPAAVPALPAAVPEIGRNPDPGPTAGPVPDRGHWTAPPLSGFDALSPGKPDALSPGASGWLRASLFSSAAVGVSPSVAAAATAGPGAAVFASAANPIPALAAPPHAGNSVLGMAPAGSGASDRGAGGARREAATRPATPVTAAANASRADAPAAAERPLAVGTAPAGLPVAFVENRGQWADPGVRFASAAGPVSAGFTDTAIRLSLGTGHTPLGLAFEDALPGARVAGEAKGEAYFNYFLGDDPSGWRTRVPTYGGVRYEGLYDGVDVRVREGNGGLEYDVLLGPGADLGRVSIRADGASGLDLATDGALLIHTPDGDLRQPAPVTWEVLPDGRTSPVETRFRLIDGDHFGFDAAGRDSSRPLVVDPGLEWSTYLGGSDLETVETVAVAPDGTGDVVVAGGTQSPTFYGAAGLPGHTELLPYVARLDATGSTLKYATVFGSGRAIGLHLEDMALDAGGGPVLVGTVRGSGMPVTPGAYDPTFNSVFANGQESNTDDMFVARFDATGSNLVFSTYLGTTPTLAPPGSAGAYAGGGDVAREVAVDAAGNVVVAGASNDAGFPTTAGAYDRTYRDGSGVVARLNPTGTQLTYSTFYGKGDGGLPTGLAVDPAGFVTLIGPSGDGSGAITFPTTADAVKRDHAGNLPGHRDAYLARFKLDGGGAADLKYATLFPGNDDDQAWGLAVDPNNPELVTVVGDTRSYDFVTTRGAYQRIPADPIDWQAAFATRFRFPAAGGGQLVWSTLLGTEGFPSANGVAVDSAGNAVIVGTGAPVTTDGAYDRLAWGGMSVVRLSADGKRVLYGTQLGGSREAVVLPQIAVTGPDSVVVAGQTLAADYPTTPGAFDRVLNADGTNTDPNAFYRQLGDGVVSKLTLQPLNPADTTAAAPTLLGPAAGAAFPAPTTTAPTVDVTFDWADATDPSGVRGYDLEVSPDADFVANRLNVSEWTGGFTTASQMTVTFAQFFGHLGTYSWRVRTLDGANNYSPWSEARTLNLGQATVARVSSVRLASTDATGGGTVTGTVVLQDRPAPAGGFVINLTSSNPAAARVPATVTVPAGATRVSFPVTTSAVSKSMAVMLTADDTGLPDRTVLWVDPGAAPAAAVAAVTFAPSTVTGGGPAQGTVTLTAPAPAGGLVVTLSSGGTAVTLPATVTVPAGVSAVTFTATTAAVSATTAVAVTAAGGGVSRSGTLTVTPATTVVVANLTVGPTSATGGTSATGTVTLSGPAPAGGLVVSLASSAAAVAGPPATVTVPAGATTATFAVTTAAVTTTTLVTLTAGGATRSATLTVTPRPADTVSVTRAEYTVSKKELRVEATSAGGSATLQVFGTGTNQLIGTLTNNGGGKFSGTFAWPTNPQTVTVRSSLGGSAGRSVTAK